MTSDLIPKSLVRLVCVLILAVLGLVSYVVYIDRIPSAIAPQGNIIQTKMINLDATKDGAVKITDSEGQIIADLAPGQAGFVFSIYRTIKRKRALSNVEKEGLIILTLDDLGRLRVSDPLSGWNADLMSFGSNNSETFARFLEK